MAEETQEQSTGDSFKNIIIGFVSTITLGVGGWVTTKLTGGKEEDKPATTQPAIIINNSQQQQAAQSGKTVVIKEKETAKPAAQPAKPKKEGDEFKEKPAQW